MSSQCDLAALSAYRDDSLSPSESRAMQEHMESCPACRERLAEYARLGAELRAIGPVAVPPTVDLRVRGLHAAGRTRGARWPVPGLAVPRWPMHAHTAARPAWAAVALAVLLAAGLIFGMPFADNGPVVAAAYLIDDQGEPAIEVHFSTPVDRESVARSVRIEPAVELAVSWRTDNTMVVKASAPLPHDQSYTLSLKPKGSESVATPVALQFQSNTPVTPVSLPTVPPPTATPRATAPLAAAPTSSPTHPTATATRPTAAAATRAGISAAAGTPAPTPTSAPISGTAGPSRAVTPSPSATARATTTSSPTGTVAPTATSVPATTSTPPATPVPATTSTPPATSAPTEKPTIAAGTPTPTPTPTSTPSTAPTPTETPWAQATPESKASQTPIPSTTSSPGQASIPSATSTPTETPASTATSTPTPTATATAQPTVFPLYLAATPAATPDIAVVPDHGFGAIYREYPIVAARLGPAISQEQSIQLTRHSFQRGAVLERDDLEEIVVLRQYGTWVAYQDDWQEGESPGDMGDPPLGMVAPAAGVGKLWRDHPLLQLALGWGTAQPALLQGVAQEFAGGRMVATSYRLIYVLYRDGTWQTFADTYVTPTPAHTPTPTPETSPTPTSTVP